MAADSLQSPFTCKKGSKERTDERRFGHARNYINRARRGGRVIFNNQYFLGAASPLRALYHFSLFFLSPSLFSGILRNNPCRIPYMHCIILSLLEPSHDDWVLEVKWDLKKKNHESLLFFARVNTDQFLFTLAKNFCNSWLFFLWSHSTSRTSLLLEGAISDKITCCVQGIWQGLLRKRGCTFLLQTLAHYLQR